jgi:hypothetical protein
MDGRPVGRSRDETPAVEKNPARGAPVNLSEYEAGIGCKVFAVSSFLFLSVDGQQLGHGPRFTVLTVSAHKRAARETAKRPYELQNRIGLPVPGTDLISHSNVRVAEHFAELWP